MNEIIVKKKMHELGLRKLARSTYKYLRNKGLSGFEMNGQKTYVRLLVDRGLSSPLTDIDLSDIDETIDYSYIMETVEGDLTFKVIVHQKSESTSACFEVTIVGFNARILSINGTDFNVHHILK